MAVNKRPDTLQGLETEIGLHVSTSDAAEKPEERTKEALTANALLAQMLLRKLEKEQAEDTLKAELRQKLLKRNLEMIREQIAATDAAQAACGHVKENGKASISGQRIDNGHFVFICVRCAKLFDEFTLPPHLANSIPPGTIGGRV